MAIAEVIGTFDSVEEISAEQREGIGSLADWLWKITVPVTTWHMPCTRYDGIYELPKESHFFSYLPVECTY